MIKQVQITPKGVAVQYGTENDDDKTSVDVKTSALPGTGLTEAWNRVKELVPHILYHTDIGIRHDKDDLSMTGKKGYQHLKGELELLQDKICTMVAITKVKFKPGDTDKGRAVQFEAVMTDSFGDTKIVSPWIYYDLDLRGYEGIAEKIAETLSGEVEKFISQNQESIQLNLFDEQDEETGMVVDMQKRRYA